MARIRDSLPNGYCGRLPQQDCPHPNACLTCPDFQTTPEFLDIHRQQAKTNRKLIARAEANGQFRLVDNLRQVQASLEASSQPSKPSPTTTRNEQGRQQPLPPPSGRGAQAERPTKASQVIERLDRQGEPITFAAVAAAADVSRSWLYRQSDLRERSTVSEPATVGQSELPLPSGPATPPSANGWIPPETRSLSYAARTPNYDGGSNTNSANSEPYAPPERPDARHRLPDPCLLDRPQPPRPGSATDGPSSTHHSLPGRAHRSASRARSSPRRHGPPKSCVGYMSPKQTPRQQAPSQEPLEITAPRGTLVGRRWRGILGRRLVILGWMPSGWVNSSFNWKRLFEAIVPQSER